MIGYEIHDKRRCPQSKAPTIWPRRLWPRTCSLRYTEKTQNPLPSVTSNQRRQALNTVAPVTWHDRGSTHLRPVRNGSLGAFGKWHF